MALTKRQIEAEARRQRQRDIKAVARTPEGLRFICSVLETLGLYRLSFNAENTHATAFREGERNAGLRLLAQLDEADPGIYLRIIQSKQEQKDRERIERERNPDADPDTSGHAGQ
ncbi:hypothetical protein [Pseudoxanthomonas sp. X-1]|uniref:Bbp19 family protein n=1 Tax=Pseudoxanthomonas sp. X-1 TaxID=2571115 RepID=UPI00110B4342|nr:hypothetical protein [Pseudoxanthomonas sp. X-1]TMN24506.1 hypothetical protein FF950_05340 [Pseudoxanthomonas sp. X-1]UAY75228.1 hypothetical protein LAJ50_02890 [Pseudoxanthomonas sp. X-1]